MTQLEVSQFEKYFELATKGESIHVNFFESIASTNQWLLEQSSLQKTIICATDNQTQGRGRRGRHWSSQPGDSLCFSVGIRLNISAAKLSGLSLVIGIVLEEVLQPLIADSIKLKWPNDLLVNERKLSGILVETKSLKKDHVDLVIGVGINLGSMTEREPGSISLSECQIKQPLDVNYILAQLVAKMLSYLEEFERSGFSSFQQSWLNKAAWYKKPVNIITAEQTVSGIYSGIDVDGALILEHNGETKSYVAGEVSLRRDSNDTAN